MGPLVLGLEGKILSANDRRRLMSSTVGGVILFRRNYESPSQLQKLCAEVHAISSDFVIMVDQEGGRVMRFREGFSPLPPPGSLSDLNVARETAKIMASELLALGVDLSLSPLVDLRVNEEVIGDRAFHSDPERVIELARAWISGMHELGMKSVIKHFPGHGSVRGDTHHQVLIDDRPWSEIEARDLRPFLELIHETEGVMASHVIYSGIDENPASFSRVCLDEILRKKMGFSGAILTDDLGMRAAQSSESPLVRVLRALEAGADGVLLCNDFSVMDEVLSGLPAYHTRVSLNHLKPGSAKNGCY